MALGAIRAGTASTGSTSPRSPALPASVVSGELLVLHVAIEGTSCSVSTPTGYTAGPNAANGTTLRSVIFWKIAGASETGPSVTSSGTSRMQIYAIPGAHATTPAVNGSTTSGSSTAPAVPTLSTPGTRGAMLFHGIASSVAGTAITADWRMTLLAEGNSGGTTTANCRGGAAVEAGMSEDAPTPSGRVGTAGSGTWASAGIWIIPATAQTFGLRQSAKANSTGTGVNTLTATMPENGVTGSFITAEVSDWYWLTFGYPDGINYNGGLNFTRVREHFEGAIYAGLYYYQNNAQTTPPAVVVHQSAADAASMSLIAKEWIGVATTGTPYEAESSANGSSTTATVTSGTMTSGQRLVIVMNTWGGAMSAIAPDVNYATRWIQPTGGSNWQPAISQDREMAGGGTTAPSITWTTSQTWCIVVAAFKPPSGAVTNQSVAGALTAAGVIVARVNKPVTGSQALSGLLVRQPIKVYAGTVTSVGTPRLQTNKKMGGTLTSSGLLSSVKVASLSVAGALSLGGILVRKTNKLLTGAVTSAGILVRFVSRAFAGTLGSSGALSQQTNKRITGTLALAGTFAQRTNKLLSGTLTDVGAVRQGLSRAFTAALAPIGAVRKQVNKLLPRGVHYDAHLPYDAHIPYDGAVAPILFLDGSIQPVKLGAGGAQTLSVGGTLSSAGVLQKQVNKIVAGAVTLTGALARLPSKTFPGTLGSSGALSRQTNKRITGTLTLVGTVAQRTNKLFVGTLTSAGSNVAVKITGTLQTLSVAGTVTLSGTLTQIKKKFVTLTGALTSTGVLRRMTQKNLTGAVTPAGVVHFFLPRKFTGVLGLAGAAFKQANKTLKRGLHYDAPLQYDAHIHYDSHEAPMLFLKGSMTRDKSGVAGVFLFGTLNSSGLVSKLLNKALAGTLILSGPVTLVTRRFITKFSRMVTKIQLDSRFTGLRHVASKIGVAVTTHAQTQRIVTKIAKKISIAPRVER